jgi:hypothetical protein
MGDISTRSAHATTIKVKNTRNDAVVDAVLDRVSHDGKSITIILAKTKIQMNRVPGKPGLWVAQQLGMELTAYYTP